MLPPCSHSSARRVEMQVDASLLWKVEQFITSVDSGEVVGRFALMIAALKEAEEHEECPVFGQSLLDALGPFA